MVFVIQSTLVAIDPTVPPNLCDGVALGDRVVEKKQSKSVSKNSPLTMPWRASNSHLPMAHWARRSLAPFETLGAYVYA